MKGRSLVITAVLSMLAGALLIALYRTISITQVVLACGVLFIFAGIIDMLAFIGHDRSRRSGLSVAFGWVASTGTVILGLAMLIFRSQFEPLVPFMFGILLVFAALFQFFLLAVGVRPARLPGWLYIVPVLLTGAGVYLFAHSTVGSQALMIVAGVSIALFGLAMLVESIILGSINHHALKVQRTAESQQQTVDGDRRVDPSTADMPRSSSADNSTADK